MPTSMLRKLAACLLLAGVLLSPTLAFANSGEDKAASRSLRLNVSPNGYPPYLIVEDGRISGIVWDVVSHISEQLRVELEPIQIPRKRVDQMIQSGYIDATSRAIEWTDQPEKFLFTDAIVPVEEVFFYLATSPLEFQSISDLESKTFLTHLGYHYPYLQDLFDQGLADRFDVSVDLDLFRYLRDSQRFDAAIADRLVGQWLIRNNPQLSDNFESSEHSVSNFGLRLMVRKDMEAFVRRFNSALAELKASDEFDRILARYR
ncbi:substrate-binding periplasmic protein [Marinobacter mobilis]|uniref:Amino acid ABC transporter substrate-binding protein, PAAT family (TC 3.A.1.3.-) n=1 Tax=Marinobacter mobilis TaxID=488533 RepID=A0A1H2ZAM6_9GAMM|nr:ABC transporter substrate-binding protein [Marinobacter mobilis]SDX14367.1 amino acid ABC transporter substrate-binding protein, PAAT family (TC 3.A.1.3.-) [Marinobacter mobilis]